MSNVDCVYRHCFFIIILTVLTLACDRILGMLSFSPLMCLAENFIDIYLSFRTE